MSEKLCLQWNEFKESANVLFENLREDNDFADVTLACEDGKEVKAHKVILAASSPLFKTLLTKHKHPHPLIFIRGINSENLEAIVDFLYRGEANVLQDNLDSFLLIAEDLKLKGLVGPGEEVGEEKALKEESKSKLTPGKPNNQADSNVNSPREKEAYIHQEEAFIHKEETFIHKEGVTLASSNNSDEYLQQLDEKVKSMIEKSEKKMRVGKSFHRVNICKVCGKEGQWVAIRDHIEANHLEGVSLACNQCEKTFRSRVSLRMHRSIIHKTG